MKDSSSETTSPDTETSHVPWRTDASVNWVCLVSECLCALVITGQVLCLSSISSITSALTDKLKPAGSCVPALSLCSPHTVFPCPRIVFPSFLLIMFSFSAFRHHLCYQDFLSFLFLFSFFYSPWLLYVFHWYPLSTFLFCDSISQFFPVTLVFFLLSARSWPVLLVSLWLYSFIFPACFSLSDFCLSSVYFLSLFFFLRCHIYNPSTPSLRACASFSFFLASQGNEMWKKNSWGRFLTWKQSRVFSNSDLL